MYFGDEKAMSVDKDKLKNLGIISAENLEKGEKMSEQEVIKALESSTQKGRDMLVIGKENLSEAVLKWAIKNNKKSLWIFCPMKQRKN